MIEEENSKTPQFDSLKEAQEMLDNFKNRTAEEEAKVQKENDEYWDKVSKTTMADVTSYVNDTYIGGAAIKGLGWIKEQMTAGGKAVFDVAKDFDKGVAKVKAAVMDADKWAKGAYE